VIGQASWFWMNLRTDWPVRSIALFFLAVPLVPWNRTRGALPALALASVCGFAAIVQAFPLSTTFHVARYYFAFVFATALAVTMAVWGARLPPHRYRVRLLSARALVLGALAWQAWSIGATSSAVPYRVYLSLAANAVGSPSSLRDRGDAYRALQAAIPAGAPVLAMLDEPFWLDFRRNPIALADLPGHASPSPGLPVDDTDALVHYLAMQGVRYLAFVRPSKSIDLYQPRKWVAAGYVSMLPQSERLASGYIWRNAAPRYLKFFDRLDDLMISRPRLYDDGTFVVLDLQDSWW